MQVALDVPALRGHRVNDRHPEILLELLDDIERAPGRAQHVDRLRLAVLKKDALDETIDLEARKLLHLVEVDVHARHCERLESRLDEVLGVDLVDVTAEIGGAHEALDLERG